MKKKSPFIFLLAILGSFIAIIIFFGWPREIFIYQSPLQILTLESTPGGEIAWKINVCKKYEAEFIASRFLVSVDTGTLYELPESSVASTLNVGDCVSRERSTVITNDIPPGTYGLLIKITPLKAIYNYRVTEVRSFNTIKIK